MDPRFQPAEAALARGDVTAVAALLAADPGLATDRSGCGHPTLMQALVLAMPPVPALERLIDLLADGGSECTGPLVAASGVGNLRAMTRLIERGADVNGDGPADARWSPLEEALYWGHEAAVALLLGRGAAVRNLRTAAALGDRAAMAACVDAAGALTTAAGTVEWPFGPTIPDAVRLDPRQVLDNALVHAAAWGRADAVEWLLERGAGVNRIPAGFDFAGTALHYAALRGHRDLVDRLLGRGADPGVREAKIGKLPEDWAEHDGHAALADHLRRARLQAP